MSLVVNSVSANKELEKRFKEGVQWKQVCFYHDEITVECDPDIAEAVKVILEEGISRSSEYFKLSIPQVGEGAIGQNWMEVHSPWWVSLLILMYAMVAFF